jgi:hypothetical protein
MAETYLIRLGNLKGRISKEAAARSDFLNTQVELVEDGDAIELIEIVEENQFVFDKLLEFLETAKSQSTVHVSRPLKRNGDLLESGVPEWAIEWLDSLFQKNTQEEGWNNVFNLLALGDFIADPCLVKILCAKIASRICAMDEETKQVVFKPSRELSPEEQEKIHQENKWAEEDAPGKD